MANWKLPMGLVTAAGLFMAGVVGVALMQPDSPADKLEAAMQKRVAAMVDRVCGKASQNVARDTERTRCVVEVGPRMRWWLANIPRTGNPEFAEFCGIAGKYVTTDADRRCVVALALTTVLVQKQH